MTQRKEDDKEETEKREPEQKKESEGGNEAVKRKTEGTLPSEIDC